jgi:hypothetical protein
VSKIPHSDPVREGMQRVSAENPCPVCGKPDWCLVAPDGSAAICTRTQSAKRCGEAGWLHRRTEPAATKVAPKKAPTDWRACAATFAANLDANRRAELATTLRLPAEALAALSYLGFNPTDSAGACFTFAEMDVAGNVVGLLRRFCDGSKKAVSGSKRGLTLPVGWKDGASPVFIVEGASDVLAMTAAGLTAIGRPSKDGGVKLLVELLKDETRDVVVIGEHDRKEDGSWPGRAGAVHVATALAQALGQLVRWALPPVGAKDVRAWLTSSDRGELPWTERGEHLRAHFAAHVEVVGSPIPPTADPADPPRPPEPDGTPSVGVRLHFQKQKGVKHKVSLLRTDTGALLHLDTIDLNSATARKRFVSYVRGAFPELAGEALGYIESELLKYTSAPTALPTATAGTAEPADPLKDTPTDIVTEAEALLTDDNLFKRIVADIGAVGVCGEKELVATLYLVGVSRLLAKPLAAIVRGSSSSGKSYIVERVASLLPPEAVIHATQMTPQALFHMPPGSLSHRWVVAGERSRVEDDDCAEATRALREMLSAGKLVKLMPVKAGNDIVTKSIEQDGPIAFSETTTLANIFDEDANRCLLLATDESAEQTRRVVEAACRTGAGPFDRVNRIVQIHHTLQRLLPRGPMVAIPFAAWIGAHFNCERVEARRALPQLLSLIRASALLHFRQRQTDANGAIVAEPVDYQIARNLSMKPFGVSLGGAVSAAAAAFLKSLPADETFTARKVAQSLKKSKRSVDAWISTLLEAGSLEVVEPGRGRLPTVWRVTGIDPQTGAFNLPTAEALIDECSA